MCGIIGYVGNQQASPIILDGLKKLEYRGYDSAGVTLLNCKAEETIKSVGKIANLEKKLGQVYIDSKIGIGHTRWATHGKPDEINCHPHQVGKVTLVHNGIIENYLELKAMLRKKGYFFESDTDTEVAAALIDYCYKGYPIGAINAAKDLIEGSYALSIMFNDDPDNLYGIRKESPLVLGVAKDENFIASDIPPFLEHTDKYIDLEEGIIAKVSKEDIKLYDNFKEIKGEIKTSPWTLEAAEKNGYEHFMLKEMYEQPETLNKIISKYNTNLFPNEEVLDLSKYKDIHIVACGSAYHAGVIGQNLLENYANTKEDKFNIKTEVASEYRYKKQIYTDDTLVMVISQSGETADTKACLQMANEQNVDTLALVNVQSSSIAKEAKYMMPLLAGPEIAVATTKGYFAQVALLSELTLKLCDSKKTLTKEEIKETIKELKDLSGKLKPILDNKKIKDMAKEIYTKDDIFFIGRGLDYGVSLEAALKLKEIAYINSNAYQAGELKHGPIALIEEDTPVIAICTDKKLMSKTISNIKEVKARGANVLLFTTEEIDEMIPKTEEEDSFYNSKIVIPNNNDFNQTLSTILPLQRLSYEVAKLRSCDIDKPKNLAKSVTVE